MKRLFIYIAGAVFLLAFTAISCKRDPLHELDDRLEIRFNFDLSEDDPAMHVKPRKPTLMTVSFYRPKDHSLVKSYHFRPEGGKIIGLEPGTYDILAYGSNTEYTQVKFTDNLDDILACTYEVKAVSDTLGRTIREPDHLLTGILQEYNIPYRSTEDTTFVITADVATIMDSYYLQVDSLKGLENINSVDVYLMGHAEDNHIGQGKRGEEPVTLHIPCRVDLDKYCLCSSFCTFGKIPGSVGKAYLHIIVTGAGGRTYDFEEDITEQYNNPSHILNLCFHGEIKPREQSGFEPKVDQWDDDVTDIVIN